MGTLGFLIVLSLALGIGAWLLFMWSVRSGQYDDPEGPKYRMLDDDERPPPSEPPGPPAGGSSGPSKVDR